VKRMGNDGVFGALTIGAWVNLSLLTLETVQFLHYLESKNGVLLTTCLVSWCFIVDLATSMVNCINVYLVHILLECFFCPLTTHHSAVYSHILGRRTLQTSTTLAYSISSSRHQPGRVFGSDVSHTAVLHPVSKPLC
jgi:hypothetical protein